MERLSTFLRLLEVFVSNQSYYSATTQIQPITRRKERLLTPNLTDKYVLTPPSLLCLQVCAYKYFVIILLFQRVMEILNVDVYWHSPKVLNIDVY